VTDQELPEQAEYFQNCTEKK